MPDWAQIGAVVCCDNNQNICSLSKMESIYMHVDISMRIQGG